jgi:hypothetical protein
MERAAFYSLSPMARTANYMGAWGLVHLLHDGPAEYRRRYLDLSARLNAGTPFRLAWKATFAGVSRADLEAAFRKHLSGEIPTHPVPYTPRPQPPVGAPRVMAPAEVHLLWARLGHWKGKDAERIREHIAAAAAHAPSSPEVSFLRGLHALWIDKDPDAAVPLMEQAHAARPTDAEALLGLALALELQGERGRVAPPARLVEVLAALSRAATTATELGYLARREARFGDRDAALALALRAVKADPTHAPSLETYAVLAADRGDLAEAISAQERAIAMLDERSVGQDMVERLIRYIRRHEAGKGTAPQKEAPRKEAPQKEAPQQTERARKSPSD